MIAKTKCNCLNLAQPLLSKLKYQEYFELTLIRKIFDQEQNVERKSNRWPDRKPRGLVTIMLTKFPTAMMVLGVASNEGNHMLLRFFLCRSLSVHAADYKDVLQGIQRS